MILALFYIPLISSFLSPSRFAIIEKGLHTLILSSPIIMSFGYFLQDVHDLTTQLLPRILPYKFSSTDLLFLPSSSDGECNKHIDILTYNVEFTSCKDESRSKLIVSAIIESNADVVFLQETNELWEQKLLNLLPSDDSINDPYPYRYFHHPVGFRSAAGSGILSRWPLVDMDIVDSTKSIEGSVFPTLIGTIDAMDTLGCTIRFANIHLRPPLELSGEVSLSTARTTGSVRNSEIKELLRLHHDADFDIMAGDFNEQDSGHALSYLTLERGMQDSLAKNVPKYKETHRWPFAGMTLHKRLDHIMYAKSKLQCLGCGVLTGYEKGASDHQPVLARFALAIDNEND